MTTSTAAGATAFTVSPVLPSGETDLQSTSDSVDSGVSPNLRGDRTPQPEHIRHMLFGTLAAVQTTIRHLHHLGYAEPNDWSRPISTGRANEVMAILTKRIRLG
ncbi:MAG: hypothetical protein AAFP20_24375 [Cyanobacteria bacterium J06614_10]